MSEITESIAYEDVVHDEGVDYNITTLVLQALQTDPREIHINDDMTINDLYFYHFQEQTPQNDQLFREMIYHASSILCVPIKSDLKFMDLIKTLTKSKTDNPQEIQILHSYLGGLSITQDI